MDTIAEKLMLTNELMKEVINLGLAKDKTNLIFGFILGLKESVKDSKEKAQITNNKNDIE